MVHYIYSTCIYLCACSYVCLCVGICCICRFNIHLQMVTPLMQFWMTQNLWLALDFGFNKFSSLFDIHFVVGFFYYYFYLFLIIFTFSVKERASFPLYDHRFWVNSYTYVYVYTRLSVTFKIIEYLCKKMKTHKTKTKGALQKQRT